MTNSIKKPPRRGHVQIHIPSNLEPAYSNFAVITNSPSEIIIDFAQIMPSTERARVKARIVMTPTNAKLVQRALTEHIGSYETQHGEIKIPDKMTLADQLFRPPFSTDDTTDE